MGLLSHPPPLSESVGGWMGRASEQKVRATEGKKEGED